MLTGSIANARCTAPQTSFDVRRSKTGIEDWWRMTGSNRRPPACKAGALPAELIPRSGRYPRGLQTASAPDKTLVGLDGFEPSTPALSRRCSNRLSYRPLSLSSFTADKRERSTFDTFSSRKEVIQPHLPIRLPCYDFTPVMNHTLGACLPCGLAQPLLVQSTPMV